MRNLIKIKLFKFFLASGLMPWHPMLNAAAVGILSLAQIFNCTRMPRHWVVNVVTFTTLPRFLVLLFFSMLRHWSYCQFLNSVNAMVFNPQCLGIQSTFFILHSFCIFSFFFQSQCSSYHLQHKIPRKSVQNDNNTNKIPKYRDFKIHIFLVLSKITNKKQRTNISFFIKIVIYQQVYLLCNPRQFMLHITYLMPKVLFMINNIRKLIKITFLHQWRIQNHKLLYINGFF